MGYEFSQFQAIEACFVAKGGYKTNGKGDFSIESFIQWVTLNQPLLKHSKKPVPVIRESAADLSFQTKRSPSPSRLGKSGAFSL